MWLDDESDGCVFDTVDCTQCGGCGRYNKEQDEEITDTKEIE